ncbi:hypothetical protein SSBR45G_18180 [Bradyrhizobium sp. SSBR45G]|nr:hypothetical protein SSBR45G_18180 [Bradyrhizobium sp. SSBR45G]GLH83668.1 hypothetical protein SSBR45R_11280 [Bradyrhizobium sp. SSBR45R]
MLAAVSPADMAGETTSSLMREPVPGIDTLSETDRGVETALIDMNEVARLPLVSRAVRANARGTSTSAVRTRPTDRSSIVLRPVKRTAEPVRKAMVPCRQLDPIARFLASAKIGPRCQA